MGQHKDRQVDKEKFVLRLPNGMRETIFDQAKNAQRSMNSEIIYRLSASLEAEDEIRRLREALDTALQVNRMLKAQVQGASA